MGGLRSRPGSYSRFVRREVLKVLGLEGDQVLLRQGHDGSQEHRPAHAWQGHASWLHVAACKLKKYREDGDPKIRDVRVDERRATSAEQRWLG
eukprot:COSAG01_NODE_641_length_14573_cov_17.634637_2_plen_93_part_00